MATITGGRFAPGRRNIAPINSLKKVEYEKSQQLLLALHEQEKMDYLKRMEKYNEMEKKRAEKREEIKK